MKTTTPLKTTKPMKQVGKVQKRTAAAVAKWKRTQQPNHEGYYECYICHVRIPYLMAEHVKSKVRRPDLRTDPANFKPTCADCNRKKGSQSYG
jgi:5-methylcytosine-specific restriction endonuclease McrA